MSWVAITTDVPGLVELDEQAQQPLRQSGIDVAGRLVGEQQLRPRDHRARDRRALLLAARRAPAAAPTCARRARPSSELHHLVAIAVLGCPITRNGSATFS